MSDKNYEVLALDWKNSVQSVKPVSLWLPIVLTLLYFLQLFFGFGIMFIAPKMGLTILCIFFALVFFRRAIIDGYHAFLILLCLFKNREKMVLTIKLPKAKNIVAEAQRCVNSAGPFPPIHFVETEDDLPKYEDAQISKGFVLWFPKIITFGKEVYALSRKNVRFELVSNGRDDCFEVLRVFVSPL